MSVGDVAAAVIAVFGFIGGVYVLQRPLFDRIDHRLAAIETHLATMEERLFRHIEGHA